MAADSDAPDGPTLNPLDGSDPPVEASDEIDTDDLDWETLMDHGHFPEGEEIELPPPRLKQSNFGLLGEFYQFRKHRKKEKKLAKKGYIKWYLIDGTWSWPKYIKPERNGGGIPEYRHDEKRYLFPERARVPDASAGMHMVVHKAGDATPINLTDLSEFAVDPDALDNYIGRKVTSDPPSFWSKFDFEAESIIYFGIGLIIVFAVVSRFLGGGV